MKILLLTRSVWSEPPKLRQQLATLLAENQHQVVFMQRPYFLRRTKSMDSQVSGIRLFNSGQLIHHQLRYFGFLRHLNQRYVIHSLRELILEEVPDVVVNFNYDYGFLKRLLPHTPFITILNDDFAARAKPGMRKNIQETTKKTCQESDAVMCVSYPIRDTAMQWNKRTKLFLPWSDTAYRKPNCERSRSVALYFGFINYRVDWRIVEGLVLNGTSVRFVGPIENSISHRMLSKLKQYENFEYLPSRPLSQVPLDDVCCSILPYDTSLEAVRACTVNNRVFQLLARGIPIVYADLPQIIKAPVKVIQKAKNLQQYTEAIVFFSKQFPNVQESIAEFLSNHTADDRYREFVDVLSEIEQ